MKKIITALNNPKTNEELKKQSDFLVIGKDIQYLDGVFEILELNNEIDLLIISEQILGENKFDNFTKKIKELKNNIKVLIIFNKGNKEVENINQKNFYVCHEKESLKNIILDILENKKSKEIIENKKNNILKINIDYKNKLLKENKIKNKIITNMNISKNKIKREENKKLLIAISGDKKVGKTITSILLFKYLKNYNKIIINLNKKNDIYSLLKKENKEIQVTRKINLSKIKKDKDIIIIDLEDKFEKENKKKILSKTNINIIIIEPNLLGITEGKKIIDFYIKKCNIPKNKIFILINKYNKNSISKDIIKKNLYNLKIIGKIKINDNYEKIINSCFEKFFLNKKIKIEFLEIINNIKKLNKKLNK